MALVIAPALSWSITFVSVTPLSSPASTLTKPPQYTSTTSCGDSDHSVTYTGNTKSPLMIAGGSVNDTTVTCTSSADESWCQYVYLNAGASSWDTTADTTCMWGSVSGPVTYDNCNFIAVSQATTDPDWVGE